MGVGSAFVAKPNRIVLDLGRGLVVNLVHTKKLATALLGLVDALHEIPELRLGEDNIPCEQTHPVNLWRWVLWSWCRTTNDLVLVHPRRSRRIYDKRLNHGVRLL